MTLTMTAAKLRRGVHATALNEFANEFDRLREVPQLAGKIRKYNTNKDKSQYPWRMDDEKVTYRAYELADAFVFGLFNLPF